MVGCGKERDSEVLELVLETLQMRVPRLLGVEDGQLVAEQMEVPSGDEAISALKPP